MTHLAIIGLGIVAWLLLPSIVYARCILRIAVDDVKRREAGRNE